MTAETQGSRRLEIEPMSCARAVEDQDDTRPVVFRPFRGLLAFQPEHRRFFYGREKEIQEILTDLQALVDNKKERFLVVAGASGTGKGLSARLIHQRSTRAEAVGRVPAAVRELLSPGVQHPRT